MTEDKHSLLIKNTAANIALVTDNIKYHHAAAILRARNTASELPKR